MKPSRMDNEQREQQRRIDSEQRDREYQLRRDEMAMAREETRGVVQAWVDQKLVKRNI